MDQATCPTTEGIAPEPGYRNELNRLASFSTFAHTADQSSIFMASEGLFHTGHNNIIMCFFCGISLSVCGKQRDEITAVHKKISPNCPMLTHVECCNKALRVSREDQNRLYVTLRTPYQNVFQSVSNLIVNESTTFQHLTILGLLLPELTEAGFHYKGFMDCMKCYVCGLELSEWKAYDSPWVEHAKWSSNCAHVLNVMGKTFVEKTQQLANRQSQVSYSDVLKTMPAKQFVDRCTEGTVPHYHTVGRRCREINCRGIKDELKYPQYETFSSRRSTLQSDTYKDKNNRIAIAGYFYSDQENSLLCYSCGDKKRFLNTNEIPAMEHSRTSPHCTYLRREFGDQFIHVIQESEKCGTMKLEQLIEYLPQLQNMTTEQLVERLCKADIAIASTEYELETVREKSHKSLVKPACANCQKGNSAVQYLPCCNVTWCVDCAISRKCPCSAVIDLG